MPRTHHGNIVRVAFRLLIGVVVANRSFADSLAFDLPKPVNGKDVEFISRWLMLSEAQSLVFASIVEQNRETQEQLIARWKPELQKLADAGGLLLGQGQSYTPEAVKACEEFDAARLRHADRVTGLDAALLAQLGGILSEQQAPLLHHIDQWRQRRRCLMTDWDLRHAGIDLELVILPMVTNDPTAFEQLRPVLAEYADAITAKYVEADKAAILRSTEGVRIFADTSIPANRKGIVMRERFAVSTRNEVELGRVNREFTIRIAAKFAPPLNRRFLDEVERQITPLTYPDLPVSEGYTLAVQAAAALSPEQRREIEEAWTIQKIKLKSICDQMADLEIDWREHVWTDRTFDGKDQFVSQMRSLRLERWNLHQAFLRRLIETAGPEIDQQLADNIRGSINDIEVMKSRGEKDRYPMR